MEMSTQEIQDKEAGKDTSGRKIGQSGLKIRIRLPPRKRYEGNQVISTAVHEDSENITVKNVPEQTDNKTLSTTCTAAEVKSEEASSNPPGVAEDIKILSGKEVPKQTYNKTYSRKKIDNKTRSTSSLPSKLIAEEANSNNRLGEGLCKEISSNNKRETLSRDTPPEKVDLIVSSSNPATTTGVQGEEENNYLAMKFYEVGNENTMDNGLSPENSCAPFKESCTGVTDKTLSKNLANIEVYDKVEKNSGIVPCEDADNNVLSNKHRLLHETNSNTSTKVLSEEATINCPSKNPTISALKCEEANDNPVGTSLVEATNYMATEKLSAGARNNAPRRRPILPSNDKTSKKRLRSSAEHAADNCKHISGMKPFPSVGQAVEQSSSTANLEAIKVYKAFEEKVRRTVYLDNLSCLATEAVIQMALNQFGTVRNVKFLINYTVPYDIPQSALVEMETEKDAKTVVSMLHEFPFMMSGMPRPVRAQHATAVMFNDRPRRPGGKLEFRWVGSSDPDYQNVRKFKLMSKRHEVENLALIKLELEGEELLAKQQQDDLNRNYRKLETVDTVIMTGRFGCLTQIYNMRFNEAF